MGLLLNMHGPGKLTGTSLLHVHVHVYVLGAYYMRSHRLSIMDTAG